MTLPLSTPLSTASQFNFYSSLPPQSPVLTTILALPPVLSLSSNPARRLLVVNRAHLKISPEKEKVCIYSNILFNHFIHTISDKTHGFKKKSQFFPY